MVGTLVLLAFLWVTVLTVDDYFGRPDQTLLVLLFSVCPLIVIGLADRKAALKISTIDILAFAWFSYSILNALFLIGKPLEGCFYTINHDLCLVCYPSFGFTARKVIGQNSCGWDSCVRAL